MSHIEQNTELAPVMEMTVAIRESSPPVFYLTFFHTGADKKGHI